MYFMFDNNYLCNLMAFRIFIKLKSDVSYFIAFRKLSKRTEPKSVSVFFPGGMGGWVGNNLGLGKGMLFLCLLIVF